jgi:hypothetical protein
VIFFLVRRVKITRNSLSCHKFKQGLALLCYPAASQWYSNGNVWQCMVLFDTIKGGVNLKTK